MKKIQMKPILIGCKFQKYWAYLEQRVEEGLVHEKVGNP